MKNFDNKEKLFYSFYLCLQLLLMLIIPAYVQVYISDRFDNHPDWDGSTSYPAPWDSYGWRAPNQTIIDSQAAYGDSGKGFRIVWGTSQQELAIHKKMPYQELWVGFRYKHDPNWDWGSSTRHKWIHWHTHNGNESIIINYQTNGLRFFWKGPAGSETHFYTSDHVWDNDDGNWHTFILHLKHNTNGQSDGVLSVWRDGVKLTLSPVSGYYENPEAINFNDGSSTWASYFKFGFQFHSGLGRSGQTEYWDDIIIAASMQEVLDFLGEIIPEDQPPTAPSGLKITR